jgi:hypothetical protein
MQDWTERHQGDLKDRLTRFTSPDERVPEWIDGYLHAFVDERVRLLATECREGEFLKLIAALWPQEDEYVWAPGSLRLEHPSKHFMERDWERSRWDAYVDVCEFIDHYSEARPKNDSTRERDERLVKGAGDKLKQMAWSFLLERADGHA